MGTKDLAPARSATGLRRHTALRAAVLILLLGWVAYLLPKDGRFRVVTPSPRPSPPPTAVTETPSPDVKLLPATDLIYRAPLRIRENCVPLEEPGQPFESIECTEGLSRVVYRRYANVADMDRQFDEVTGHLPHISGGCRAGQPSLDIWRYSRSMDKVEGRMACFLIPPDVPATLVTQPEQRLLSIVISNPSLGLAGHYDRWAALVPNLPTDRQPDAPEQSGAGG
jgi:hypothetical protein